MAATPVTATRTHLTIPTYTRYPARRLPQVFQDGWSNLYPETRDDILGGPKMDVDYDAIVLENEHLKLTLLPELGGKLWSAYDKNAGEDAIYVPDCIKPGLVQRCGGWIPGGMEFNFPIGHHVRSMRSLPCAILEAGPEKAVALVENRCPRSGMCLEVYVSLRRGEARFRVDYRVTNPSAMSWRWYVWNNVGVLAHDDWRMFAKAKYMSSGGHILPYPIDRNGRDISWFKNRLAAMDSFIVGNREDFFGYYDYRRDHGLVHVAPWREMPGKKCFTWGTTYRHLDAARIFNDRGDDYLEIQVSPVETQSDFEIMPSGGSRRFGGTWIPFRRIGGIEWANSDLVFHVHEGTGWLYAGVATTARVVIDGRSWDGSLTPGKPRRLPGAVSKGSRVEIHVNGELARAFTYPLKGRQEPNARERLERRYGQGRPRGRRRHGDEPRTAAEALESARRMVKLDSQRVAIRRYQKALALKPSLHAARLELAETLWRTGAFDAGAKELRKLLKTKLADQAKAMLARRAQAEEAFLQPVLAVPEGPARDLTLAERLAGYSNYDAAVKLYRKLLRTDPDNPRVHYGMAIYYAQVKHDRTRAVRHAKKAVALKPGDRDLLIELVPIIQANGEHSQVVKLLTDAPKDVQRLYICQKMLARTYFELGRYDDCWAIVSRVRLFNWEGENNHVDTYVDCATVLLEKALKRKSIKEARRLVEGITHLPPNLGVLRRSHCTAPDGYWDGIVRLAEGDADGALQIWRDALDEAQPHLSWIEKASDHSWMWWIDHESLYYYGMCALAVGDRQRAKHAVRLLKKLRKARSESRHWRDSSFLDGLIHELEGDFAAAEKAFRQHIKKASHTRVARSHLAAVRAGRRRGQGGSQSK